VTERVNKKTIDETRTCWGVRVTNTPPSYGACSTGGRDASAISVARGTIRAGLTFVFEKFAPVAIMLIKGAEHALGDLVATCEVQPLAL
jgi:hypothetical protein